MKTNEKFPNFEIGQKVEVKTVDGTWIKAEVTEMDITLSHSHNSMSVKVCTSKDERYYDIQIENNWSDFIRIPTTENKFICPFKVGDKVRILHYDSNILAKRWSKFKVNKIRDFIHLDLFEITVCNSNLTYIVDLLRDSKCQDYMKYIMPDFNVGDDIEIYFNNKWNKNKINKILNTNDNSGNIMYFIETEAKIDETSFWPFITISSQVDWSNKIRHYKKVPLNSSHILPTTIFRFKDWHEQNWVNVSKVETDCGVKLDDLGYFTFEALASDWLYSNIEDAQVIDGVVVKRNWKECHI